MTSFAEINSAMLAAFEDAPEIYQPSELWRFLNAQHTQQLEASGIETFKRTVVRQYFTWMRIRMSDPQIVFLRRQLGPARMASALLGATMPPKHAQLSVSQSMGLNLLTRLTWDYASSLRGEQLATLAEPAIGGAPRIEKDGRLISQDLANSVVEFDAMDEGGRLTSARTVCELGGGYGRTAFAVKKLHPCRYILVDIPPALAVAQWYLPQVLPDARVFEFRDFEDYADVAAEIEAADLVFLLPHQIEKLPDSHIDFFVNISSLHEMRRDQIEHYVDEVERLVRPEGYFYLKAWKQSKADIPGGPLSYEDYGLADWEEIYHRTARIQTEFFESLVRKPA